MVFLIWEESGCVLRIDCRDGKQNLPMEICPCLTSPPALDETVEALMQRLQDERKGRVEAERQLAFFRAAMDAL